MRRTSLLIGTLVGVLVRRLPLAEWREIRKIVGQIPTVSERNRGKSVSITLDTSTERFAWTLAGLAQAAHPKERPLKVLLPPKTERLGLTHITREDRSSFEYVNGRVGLFRASRNVLDRSFAF